MALAIPDVTKITSASTSAVDYMTAIRSHFNATSTKFSEKANGPSNDAFTITPDAAGENWEMNFRRQNTTDVQVCIDPLENITAPGNTTTAPTLTDSSEWSEEGLLLTVDGTLSLDFYIIELDDAVFIMFMNSGKTHTPKGFHGGRTWIPFFSDGVTGDNYADGLGLHGPVPIISSSTGAGAWVSTSSIESRIRCARTGGFTAGSPAAAWYRPSSTASPSVGDIQNISKPCPFILDAENTDASSERAMGFTKYMLFASSTQDPGGVWDGGAGQDAWAVINEINGTNRDLIPWDRTLAPDW